ncbi:MAG: MBL fold metallo-hydrolase [Patescibacteria group bacterium]
MVITYYGLACLKVQSGETVLAFDPPSKESEFKSPRFQTDIVFVSHNHKDHNGFENLAAKTEGKVFLLIDGPGEYETSGIHITGIKSFHDSSSGQKYGLNTIYKVEIEDIIICHIGDFGEKNLRPDLKENIGEIDILFIPIGGETVLEPGDASRIVSQIGPKIVIPIHYKKGNALKKFLEEVGNGESKPLEKLSIKKKDLTDNKTKVAVLEPCL